MRTDSKSSANHLHFHDGGTCHGTPTLKECTDEAIKRCWAGRVLEKTDYYHDNAAVKCYSLIAYKFEHWAQRGRFVAEVKQEWRVALMGKSCKSCNGLGYINEECESAIAGMTVPSNLKPICDNCDGDGRIY